MTSSFEVPGEDFVLDELREDDIRTLIPILETWLKNDIHFVDGEIEGDPQPQEVEEVVTKLQESLLKGSKSEYLVMRDSKGLAVGMAGLVSPDDRMFEFTETDKPVEMINVFLSSKLRGRGIGHRLVDGVIERARERGFSEVVWNSGPRYRQTAWSFYLRKYGNTVGVARKYYDNKWDAPVWSVILNENDDEAT